MVKNVFQLFSYGKKKNLDKFVLENSLIVSFESDNTTLDPDPDLNWTIIQDPDSDPIQCIWIHNTGLFLWYIFFLAYVHTLCVYCIFSTQYGLVYTKCDHQFYVTCLSLFLHKIYITIQYTLYNLIDLVLVGLVILIISHKVYC